MFPSDVFWYRDKNKPLLFFLSLSTRVLLRLLTGCLKLLSSTRMLHPGKSWFWILKFGRWCSSSIRRFVGSCPAVHFPGYNPKPQCCWRRSILFNFQYILVLSTSGITFLDSGYCPDFTEQWSCGAWIGFGDDGWPDQFLWSLRNFQSSCLWICFSRQSCKCKTTPFADSTHHDNMFSLPWVWEDKFHRGLTFNLFFFSK